jgi:CspA family cold shock protein
MTAAVALDYRIRPAEKGVPAVTVGRLVRFDEARGYGFISPRQGGADVFMHANEFLSERELLKIGTLVEYEATRSERGLRATSARALEEDLAVPTVRLASSEEPQPSGQECAAITGEQFTREVTDVIITAAPMMTGQQIDELRHELAELARNHGWIAE